MSARRKVALSALAVAALLVGAATLWQGNDGGAPRDARVLLLDPRTGKTLHEWRADGGYAVAALLAGGRVAVATLDSCPGGQGGHVTVLDPTLTRVVKHEAMAPCAVARIGAEELRAHFDEHPPGLAPDYDGGRDVILRLGRGTIVETYTHSADGSSWLTAMTAIDASGHPLWQRADLGRIGVADVRDGRVVVPVFGTFTPGSD